VKRGAKIKVSFIGYQPLEIVYEGQKTLDITISEDENLLNEVVVTALGITKEAKSLSYAATTISAKELTKVGTPNFATALYGKAPGVRIQTVQGGSIAGVSITVRGINSITGNNQPLVVMNGVPIRNGGTGSGSEATFAEFGTEGRIRSNGLIDINPEDIENLTILKGAAATALYGSEAANGVVMITSKKARKGVQVDFNAALTVNEVYSAPKYQDEYGPGRFNYSWNDYEKETGGFYERTLDGQRYRSLTYQPYAWGPKYDGSDVLYWDGKLRKYEPYTSEPWKEIFRTGYNQNYNFAVNHGNDVMQTRLTYTYNNEIPNVPEADYKKHNFQAIGSVNLSKTISVAYSANYVMQLIHNRASNAMGVYGSFSNGFSSFTDISQIKKMYKTSLGYRNGNRGDNSLTPDELYAFNTSDRAGITGTLWEIYEKNVDELSNRLIASVTPKWQILDWLTFSSQLSTDLTNDRQEAMSNSDQPIALGNDPSGGYSATSRRAEIRYGEVRLTANKKLTDKLNLDVMLGWQGQKESMLNTNSYTDGGLTTENWFDLNASRYQARTGIGRSSRLQTAFMGMLDLNWNDYLYFSVTGRQDKTSTLGKGANTFFYPSVGSSFIFTQAFRNSLPDWYQFGKFRVSYGMNGNYPGAYSANIVFEQGSNNDFIYNHVPTGLGNNLIKPEITKEIEIGLENKMFNNRFGFEITYYHRNVTDQILPTPQPPSSGVNSILLNVGTLQNYGAELSIYGTPIQTHDFSWTPAVNISRNFNKITFLVEGVDHLNNAGWGGDGIHLRSYVGRPMGDFYVYVPMENEKGEKLVTSDGYYVNDPDRKNIGNAQERFIGGFMNQFVYKNLFLDVMMDFVVGGYIFNEMYQYSTALGLTPETLKGRADGIPYYYPGNDNYNALPVAIAANATAGPNGEKIYYNGVIQEGVNVETGDPNTQIVPLDYLTYYTYNWGTDDNQLTYMHSIFSKSYMKVRELALGYTVPKNIAAKLYCKNLSVSLFARNLFYLFKDMPDWDVESSIGTSWTNRAYIGGSTAPNRSYGLTLRASF
jgi:TonB-linked SusC/RagA family outer membrane protein